MENKYKNEKDKLLISKVVDKIKFCETKNKIQSELDLMHPKAREARLKDYQKNPERKITPIENYDGWNMYEYEPLNMVDYNSELEFISPDVVFTPAKKGEWLLVNPENASVRNWVCNGHQCILYTKYDLQKGTLLRVKDNGYVAGIVRDAGR